MGTALVALDAVPVGGGVIVTAHGVVVTRPAADEVAAFGFSAVMVAPLIGRSSGSFTVPKT